MEDVPITPEPGKGSNLTNSFVSPCISPYLASCFITQPDDDDDGWNDEDLQFLKYLPKLKKSPLISQSQSSSISPENSTLDDEVADLKLDNQFIPPFYVKRCPTPVLSSELINSIQVRDEKKEFWLHKLLDINKYTNWGGCDDASLDLHVLFIYLNCGSLD